MSPRRTDLVLLDDIANACDAIRKFAAETDHDEFIRDEMRVSAVLYQFAIIGEAVKGLSENTKKLKPDVPWKAIAGMRDRLIHAYFGVDLVSVWTTVQTDIPQLHVQIMELLEMVDDCR